MKRYIPIIRSEVHGIFDQDVTGKVVLVRMDATKVSRMMIEVLENMVKREGKRGVVLSFNRPGHNIVDLLRRYWISPERVLMVDGVVAMCDVYGNRARARPEDEDHVFVLERPFDLEHVVDRLFEAFRVHRSQRAREGVGEGAVPSGLKMDLVEAEMGIFGPEGSEWSVMRHRIRERLKGRGIDMIEGPGPGQMPEGTGRAVTGDMDDDDDTGDDDADDDVPGSDFLLVEDLGVMLSYMSLETLVTYLGIFRQFLGLGLCRSVIILMDKAQMEWPMRDERVRAMIDLVFELSSNEYMGVTGYRLMPSDNGL